MGYSVALARIIQQIFNDTFNAANLLLKERKDISINESERNVILNVINKIADGEACDYIRIIEEQTKTIEELNEQLFLQRFMLIDEVSREKVREIIKKNECLKSEVTSLKNKIQLINDDKPKDMEMERVKSSLIHQLVSENNRLKSELEENRNLADLGRKMREQQRKGRRKRNDIKDEEITKLLSLGFNSHQIYKKYITDGIKCSYQTIISRVNAIKSGGDVNA